MMKRGKLMTYEEDEYDCIKYLENSIYIENLNTLRGIFRKRLDQGAASSEIKFTTHDYSTHCKNIYKIISETVVDFSKNPSKKTIFLLDVAVLLHDIVMADNTELRETHAKDGQMFVLDAIYSNDRNEINSVLDASSAKIIASAIYGHGNIKNNDGVKVNTLEELYKKYEHTKTDDDKLACQIGAALRLADELDATVDRINRPQNEYHFNEDLEKDRLSKSHHMKLVLVDKIYKDPEKNDQLKIATNDYYFEKNGFNDDLGEMILEVKNKISKELECINNYISHKIDGCFYRIFHSVEIETYNSDMQIYLEHPKKKNKKVLISDQEISVYLEEEIRKKKLLRTGNYKINSKICTHEWIDIAELLDDEAVMKKIVSKFFELSKNVVSQYGKENVIIVAAGTEGLKIGTLLAYALGCLYTYYIPEYMEKSEQDISIECENKHIIIVTDAIATGDTVDEIINKCKIQVSMIKNILSIFGREIKDNESWKYEKVAVYLNTSFQLDVIKQEECQIKQAYGKCICTDM